MTRARNAGREPRSPTRRAQLQISFHFIFALIGGLLFLLFFFILIRSVVHTSEEGDTRGLSFKVESIIRTAAATPDTFTVTSLPTRDYRFVCEKDAEGVFSYVQVGQADVADQHALDHVPVFAPRSVEGDELFTLTRTWEAPFPIGSLMVVDNNRTRYVIVDSAGALVQEEPQSFIKEQNLAGFNMQPFSSAMLASYPDTGFDRYRFILFNGNPSAIPVALRDKSTALVVQRHDKGGTLTFYDELGTGIPSATASIVYYGDAMLLAAIFSHDTPSFLCNRGKAYERLDGALLILQRRLTDIKNQKPNPLPAEWNDCLKLYNSAAGLLQAFKGDPTGSFATAAASTPGGPLPALEQVNRRLLNKQDCPLIY